ncbi:MAG: IS21/IS408/IS1162 family transposase, partial [Phocaeicola sp.]
EQYRQLHPTGYGYTQFKKTIRDYQYTYNLSYHNTYLPGVELQIDFAGDSLWLTDSKTGEKSSVVVLVCLLPYSGMGYAKALYNASMEYFFSGLSDAFTFYGGTVRKAKSDNMKQWVKKHDRYEPIFSDAALEWSAYYDTTLETCRVRAPRDKGAVEGLVRKVYNAVYAPLHHEVFHTLESLNNRIFELMDAFNSKPSKVTGRSRIEVFKSEEQRTLGILPQSPYRFRYRKEVKLTGTYHIQIDKHKYSVPYQYVGQLLTVSWDVETVEIYTGLTRVAIHTRRFTQGYSTLETHMPAKHLAYKHGQGYNAAYFLEEAEIIGLYTKAAVETILNRNRHVEQSYSSCQGVMSLKRTYGKERLENACKRLDGCSSVTYTMIKNILQKNLDQAESTQPTSTIPQHDYVRGADTFNKIMETK